MKVTAIVIRDAEGERRYTLERLPLRLGTGSDCDVRLPGPGNAPVASIDELDGEDVFDVLQLRAAPTLEPSPPVPDVLAKVSRGLGEPMVGLNVEGIAEPHRLAERGW